MLDDWAIRHDESTTEVGIIVTGYSQQRLVDRASVPIIRLHDVRHSYAMISLRSGAHLKIVRSRLGRSKVAFTLDTCTEDIPGLDVEAAETVSGLFLPKGRSDLVDRFGCSLGYSEPIFDAFGVCEKPEGS